MITQTWLLLYVLLFSLMYSFYGYWCFIAGAIGSLIVYLFF